MHYFLRELSREDMVAINNWRNDRELIESLGAPYRYINIEVDESWFSSYLGSRVSTIRLAIVERSSNLIVGATYLTGIDWVARSAEFSIWIGSKEHQGRGIGRFATNELLIHAFNDLGLNRIYLTVRADNERARLLYKAVGFREEGVHRQAIYKKGKYIDMLQMSILSSEYCGDN